MYLESRLILVDDGLSHKSIYTLAKKMEKVVFSALVKAEGFYPDINQFKVVVMAGQESAQILKIENRKPRNDGLFELGFVLDKGSRVRPCTYHVTHNVKETSFF